MKKIKIGGGEVVCESTSGKKSATSVTARIIEGNQAQNMEMAS